MLLLGKERWRDSWFSMDLLAVGTHSLKPIFICIYWYKKFISIAILFVSSLPKRQRKKNFSILQINLPTIQWKSIIPPSDLLLLNDDLRAPFSIQTKAFRLANLPTRYFPTINVFPKYDHYHGYLQAIHTLHCIITIYSIWNEQLPAKKHIYHH